jgi:hypothetical protein
MPVRPSTSYQRWPSAPVTTPMRHAGVLEHRALLDVRLEVGADAARVGRRAPGPA